MEEIENIEEIKKIEEMKKIEEIEEIESRHMVTWGAGVGAGPSGVRDVLAMKK